MNVFSGILTQYKKPTCTKGTRIIASYPGQGKHTYHWDYALNPDDNHYQAAEALRVKLGWSSTIKSGCLISGGYAWSFFTI
jgi:hypothetical protein